MANVAEPSLWFRLVLAALATWRLTHLLALEDGPFDIVARLRSAAGRLGPLGRLFDCFYCLSIWVAAPLALLVTTELKLWLLVWPALSGAACLAERATAAPVVMQPLPEGADPEGENDGLLRTETNRDRGEPDPHPPEPHGDSTTPPRATSATARPAETSDRASAGGPPPPPRR